MKLHIHTFDLQLKHPFTISRGTRTSIPSLVVELRQGEISGFGEATANPYYNTTTSDFAQKLLAKKNRIETVPQSSPEEFWSFLYPHFQDDMFLLCALDEAYHDLYCKLKKVKLYDYWKLTPNLNLKSNFTIGIDSIEVMLKKMKEADFPIYKIKLGTPDDLTIVRELRAQSNAIFRIDANCAWSAEETLTNAKELKTLGVEFIEQPLPADDWKGAKIVFENCVLPVIADESCIVESDVNACFSYFHGINIKLMKCGGLTPALRMIKKARALNMKAMVGCMTESTVGISAIAHLTPLLDYVDMDGAALLRTDIASGVKVAHGEIKFSPNFGTGAQLTTRNEIHS